MRGEMHMGTPLYANVTDVYDLHPIIVATGDHGYGVHVLGPFVGRTVRLDGYLEAALIEETWILKAVLDLVRFVHANIV